MNIVPRILYKLLSVYPRQWMTNLTLRHLKNDIGHLGSNARIAIPIQTYGLENVFIGDNFDCGERLKLRTFSEWQGVKYTPRITIGNNVCIQSDCHISAINSVEIGDNVLIASFVYISDHQHGMPNYSEVRALPPHPENAVIQRCSENWKRSMDWREGNHSSWCYHRRMFHHRSQQRGNQRYPSLLHRLR